MHRAWLHCCCRCARRTRPAQAQHHEPRSTTGNHTPTPLMRVRALQTSVIMQNLLMIESHSRKTGRCACRRPACSVIPGIMRHWRQSAVPRAPVGRGAARACAFACALMWRAFLGMQSRLRTSVGSPSSCPPANACLPGATSDLVPTRDAGPCLLKRLRSMRWPSGCGMRPLLCWRTTLRQAWWPPPGQPHVPAVRRAGGSCRTTADGSCQGPSGGLQETSTKRVVHRFPAHISIQHTSVAGRVVLPRPGPSGLAVTAVTARRGRPSPAGGPAQPLLLRQPEGAGSV